MAEREGNGTGVLVAASLGLGGLALLRTLRPGPLSTLPPMEALAASGRSFVRPGWYVELEIEGQTPSTNMLVYVPIYMASRHLYSGMGVNIWQSAIPGALLRLGLYEAAPAPTGLMPSRLLVDAGTITIGDVSGPQVLEFALESGPGYAFMAMVQSAQARYWSPSVDQNIVAPVTGRRDPTDLLFGNLVTLLTAPDPASDWPRNGLPDMAPSPAFASTAGLAIPFLVEG